MSIEDKLRLETMRKAASLLSKPSSWQLLSSRLLITSGQELGILGNMCMANRRQRQMQTGMTKHFGEIVEELFLHKVLSLFRYWLRKEQGTQSVSEFSWSQACASTILDWKFIQIQCLDTHRQNVAFKVVRCWDCHRSLVETQILTRESTAQKVFK